MRVTMKTTEGDIQLQLHQEQAPKTVENFLKYVTDGFYDNTIFHRVIDNFMIQGGGFTLEMDQKTTLDPIENEASQASSNRRGTVAMARTNDPHSASSQFFINVKDNDFLNYRSSTADGYGYCVFAEVVEGMPVVDAIKAVSTTHRDGHDDVPVEPVVVLSVTVDEAA